MIGARYASSIAPSHLGQLIDKGPLLLFNSRHGRVNSATCAARCKVAVSRTLRLAFKRQFKIRDATILDPQSAVKNYRLTCLSGAAHYVLVSSIYPSPNAYLHGTARCARYGTAPPNFHQYYLTARFEPWPHRKKFSSKRI